MENEPDVFDAASRAGRIKKVDGKLVMTRKPTIDELEKIINSEGNDAVKINPDGSIGVRTEAGRAVDERDRQLFRDNLIERLTVENKRLKAALKALTDQF
jgi:hypothetical protein